MLRAAHYAKLSTFGIFEHYRNKPEVTWFTGWRNYRCS